MRRKPRLHTIGLDISNSTGWCHLHTNGSLDSGTVKLKGDSTTATLLNFRDMLCRLTRGLREARIVFEHIAFYTSTAQSLSYNTKLGVLLLFAADFDGKLTLHDVHNQTLKKHITGHGRASKCQMASAAERFLFEQNGVKRTFKVRTENDEADAICLVRYALDTIE